MADEPKPTWPRDAAMIVAPYTDTAVVGNMESVNPAVCRDCGRDVVYDGLTMRLIQPFRHGRPVLFFCIECAVKYDRSTITHFEDHRGRTNGRSSCLRYRSEAMGV